MNADVSARLREFGQLLNDVDEAWEFVADTLADGPDEAGEATDHLVNALNSAN